MTETEWRDAARRDAASRRDQPQDVLSNPELALACVRVCAQSAEISTIDDFRTWVSEDLKRLFPHGAFLACFCTLDPIDDSFKITSLLPIDFPVRYADALRDGESRVRTPILAGMRRQRAPQLFNRGDESDHPPGWLENFERFDLRNIAAHGVTEPDGRRSSLFSFHRIPGRVGPWHSDMLKILVPQLHAAYSRAVALAQPGQARHPYFDIKAEEMEVLHWLVKGKSNWDISVITGRSQASIKRQVAQLLTTLGVGTRTQAAAKAVDLGLIEDVRR